MTYTEWLKNIVLFIVLLFKKFPFSVSKTFFEQIFLLCCIFWKCPCACINFYRVMPLVLWFTNIFPFQLCYSFRNRERKKLSCWIVGVHRHHFYHHHNTKSTGMMISKTHTTTNNTVLRRYHSPNTTTKNGSHTDTRSHTVLRVRSRWELMLFPVVPTFWTRASHHQLLKTVLPFALQFHHRCFYYAKPPHQKQQQ